MLLLHRLWYNMRGRLGGLFVYPIQEGKMHPTLHTVVVEIGDTLILEPFWIEVISISHYATFMIEIWERLATVGHAAVADSV